jgi:hypothetical protein
MLIIYKDLRGMKKDPFGSLYAVNNVISFGNGIFWGLQRFHIHTKSLP